MRQDVGETLEVSHLKLLRRAKTHCDLKAWAAFQHSLEETVLAWFHAHPGSEAASRVQSESHFVARAFEQLWHLVVQEQVACETLSEVVVCLRASLNGAILETLRDSRRPGAVSSPWPGGEECPALILQKPNLVEGKQASISSYHDLKLQERVIVQAL